MCSAATLPAEIIPTTDIGYTKKLRAAPKDGPQL